MGCVQAKSSMNSPPRGFSKMKRENGFVGGGTYNRPTNIKKHLFNEAGKGLRHNQLRNAAGGAAIDTIDRESKLLRRDGEGGEACAVSKRITMSKQAGSSDELVDGWPKWLVDNIPVEALVGLVPKSAESYDKLDKIGQGTYSNVYKARDRDTGKIVALKKVRFDTSESESVRFMAREIMILQKLDHPNIVKLEGLATSRMQYSLYLVFDFMQTDLARIICRPDARLSEPQVKCYMQQLFAGLQHCHERGILHRDIKGSNLLIDEHGMLKIADFGLANYFTPNHKRPLTSKVVTLWYRAPELLLGATDYGVGIDLWSAGCLLAEMFAGTPILPGRTEVEQLHRIFKLCGSPSEDYWRKLKLTTSFRPPQPYKPSIYEVFGDFPNSSLGLLTRLLALDPNYRGSAAAALQSEFFSTSPVACDLSGLPVIYKEKEETKKRRGKLKQRFHTKREGLTIKDLALEKPKGDSENSKEENGKGTEPSSHSQEMGSSTGSTSSGMKPIRRGPDSSLSPSPSSPLTRLSSRTEAHPWASKNIKNFPLSSDTSKANNVSGIDCDPNNYRPGLSLRSNSTVDFRKLEGDRSPRRYPLDH